jgi:hypothetical protein
VHERQYGVGRFNAHDGRAPVSESRVAEHCSQQEQTDAGSDWQAWWRQLLLNGAVPDPWQRLAAAFEGAGNDAERIAALRSELDRWRQQWRQQLPTDQDVIRALRGLLQLRHLSTPWLAAFAPAPKSPWPQLGLLQNEQARIQALHEALGAYREALLRHGDQLACVLELSLDDFETRLREQPERSDPEPLFAMWTEVASHRYQQALTEESFNRGIAELTNTWATVRARTQAVLDPVLESLGLPSARNVTDTQRHLDRLRRQHRAELTRLEARIAALEAGRQSS